MTTTLEIPTLRFHHTRRGRRTLSAGLALMLGISLLGSIPLLPDAPWTPDDPAPIAAVPAEEVEATKPGKDPTADAILTEPPADPVWPKAARNTVPANGKTYDIGGLPVTISGKKSDGDVTIRTRSQKASRKLGIEGVVVEVNAASGSSDFAIGFDYSEFATAYGADWSTRLRLSALPECALDTPADPDCAPRPLDSDNNTSKQTVTVTLDTTESTLLAITAAASGGAGDYGASSLSASQAWSAGGSSGAFSWNYQVPIPAGTGGPAPAVGLSYSSQSVDGHTASSNNQPSWVGEGFDYQPGFIERKYIPCVDDMGDSANNTEKSGDLCWFDDNAFMSIEGRSTELIKDADSGEWHAKNEDGSKVELKTGGPNGDDNGEYWVVTTTQGVAMWFGRNQLPGWAAGKTETNSVLTTPVFGNNADEPCHASAFADSDCSQAWRWQLDYIEDPWGNTSSYWYGKDTNKYGRNNDADDAATYDRDGYLKRIEFGTSSDTAYGTAPYQVVFDTEDRCLSDCTDKKTANWPDTPWDQECSAAPCTDQVTPTFWTTRRLATITTKGWTGAQYNNIDSVTLRHSFRNPGDGTRAGLFLEGITRTGHTKGNLTLPEVTFTGLQMPNRVDGLDHAPPMNWFRIGSVRTESGGEIGVHYKDSQCTPSTVPDEPDSNTKRCFPVWWNPAQYGDPDMDWFHKYVVDAVTTIDHTGGDASPRTITNYEYLGDPAWHYEDGNGLIKKKHRTWSDWRGYEKVRTIVGDAADHPVKTEALYHRGMHGDKDADGGTKTATTTGSDDKAVTDYDELSGRVREVTTYDTATNESTSTQITDWTRSSATATREVAGRTQSARFVNSTGSLTRQQLDEGRGWRETAAHTTFDKYGLVTEFDNAGDPSTDTDDTCTKTSYTRNTSKWIVSAVSQVDTYSLSCATSPAKKDDVVAITRMSYDNQEFGVEPTHGAVTSTQEAKDWSPTGASFVTTRTVGYDSQGRIVSNTDATGQTTSTVFTPATGGPVRQITTKNTLGWSTTSAIDPLRATTTYSTDINTKRSDFEYDAVGRLTKVWLPDRKKATQTPNIEYTYQLRNDAPSVQTTKSMIQNGSYVTSYVLYDSLLRQRQTQTPSIIGGRIVSDSFYDSVGRPVKAYDSWLEPTTAPGTELITPEAESLVSTVSRTEFDGAGRLGAQIFESLGKEKWRTSYIYHGDRTDVIPPQGGTVTSTVTDIQGHTVETRQYHGTTASGEYDKATYTYDHADRLTSVTDNAGNVWTTGYDFRGRAVSADDPDKGQSTMSYDDANLLITSTDSRGETLAYTYDELSRPASVRDDATDGPLRVEWSYDSISGAKGLPVAATRYVDGKAYSSAVTGYDALYRPLGTKVTIPEGHGGLTGSYTFKQTYKPDGSLATSDYPAAGGLPYENLVYYYDDTLGLPYQLGTSYADTTGYVVNTEYNALGMLQRVEQSTKVLNAPTVFQTFEYEVGTRRLDRQVISRQPATPNRLQELTFDYDPAGNITRIGDKPEVATDISGRNEVQCFRYDYLQRLKEAWTPGTDDCGADPTESSLGGPAPYWDSYGYDDKTGSRESLIEHAATADSATATTVYTTPEPGAAQPHSLTSTSTTIDGAPGAFTNSYKYDSAGNTTQRPDGNGKLQTLAWDAEGHLDSVVDTDGGDEQSSYIYDAVGSRLMAKDATGETLYLGNTELHADSTTGEVTATRYYQHAGLTVAVRTTKGGLTWLTADQQGTNNVAVSQDTSSYQQRRQDPFGNPRGPAPTAWPDNKGFVGGTIDSSGLTHVGAREYDSGAGRFISVDPVFDLSDPQSWNGYAYADDSPITKSDPSGLDAANPSRIGGGGFGAASGGTVKGGAGGGCDAGCVSTFLVILEYTPYVGDAIDYASFVKAVIDEDYASAAEYIAEMAISGALDHYVPVAGRIVGDYAIDIVKWVVKKLNRNKDEADDLADAVEDAVDGNAGDKPDGPDTDSAGGDDKGGKDDSDSGKTDDGASGSDDKPKTKDEDAPKEESSDSGSHNCNCFTEGTPVSMSDGSTKPIEEVEPGDEVVTYNTDTGAQENHVVTALFSKQADVLLEFTVIESAASDEETAGERTAADTSGTDPPDSSVGESFTVTPEHPFWDPDSRTWTLAGDLETGDHLLQRDGGTLTITAIDTIDRDKPFTVYNFTVATTHNYYATTVDTLVHNCDDGGGKAGDRWQVDPLGSASPAPRFSVDGSGKTTDLTVDKFPAPSLSASGRMLARYYEIAPQLDNAVNRIDSWGERGSGWGGQVGRIFGQPEIGSMVGRVAGIIAGGITGWRKGR